MGTYALNIADLLHPEMTIPVSMMVNPVCPNRERVNVGSNLDDSALVLECGEDQGKAIVEFITSQAKRRSVHVRAYQRGPRGGWKAIRTR